MVGVGIGFFTFTPFILAGLLGFGGLIGRRFVSCCFCLVFDCRADESVVEICVVLGSVGVAKSAAGCFVG